MIFDVTDEDHLDVDIVSRGIKGSVYGSCKAKILQKWGAVKVSGSIVIMSLEANQCGDSIVKGAVA